MAARHVTAADGTPKLEFTTFQQRKAARIAAGARQFRFDVRNYQTGVVVGTFVSRREAEDFIRQNGPWGIQTQAHNALSKKTGWTANASFSIERVETTARVGS